MTRNDKPSRDPLAFLAGGGEMGASIRALDWTSTPLGPPESWPQSLRSPLSMMLPSKAQIILFWGPEFSVFYNDAYRPVFGAKHPGMLGRPGREAWSEIWDSMLHGLLEGVVRTGEAFWAKDLLFPIERYGFLEETYFDVSYDPVRDESGRVGGVYCIVTETTARVVWERRLALQKDLAARNAAARAPREACVLAMETLAAKPDDVSFALAYLDDELQAWTPGAQAALAAAKPQQIKVVPIARSGGRPGKLVVGLNLKRPFDEEYQSFLELVAVQLSTAVANAQAYEDERKRAEALAELDRAKTVFFSNVSHEFRTPLTLMLGPVEELLSRSHTELSPAAADQLEVVNRNGLRLLRLVNTLLDFSRIEAGRVQAVYQPTDLATFTAELASIFRSACERAGLRLTVDCPPLAEPVFVDRDMWEKVVLNLLSNAFKFTFEGGITVTLRQVGRAAELRVSDTGTGIPAEEMPRLFERFHRVKSSRGRTHEGSGIGLALVQELVKLHGGAVRAQSIDRAGTTFIATIPLGSVHLPADRITHDRTLASTAVGAIPYIEEALRWLPAQPSGNRTSRSELPIYDEALPTPAPPPAQTQGEDRPRVLVADDNADMRQYLTRLLAERYEVEAVPDGEAALAAARERLPALVLTDVMMPRLDGFGLLQEMRADARTSNVPIIMLTARAGEESRVEGVEAGVDDYLVKPFSARELLARVSAHIQMARMRQEANSSLRESEERFRALVSASSDVVYRMNADWTEMRFLRGREFIADTYEPSRTWLEKYIHPDDRRRVMEGIREAIRTKSIFELEHRVLRLDGTLGWTFSRAVPLLDASGDVVEWFGAASDVTARKQAEEALKDADRRKDEFLATLSHELRNPLAPLRNGLEIMRLAANAPEAIERVRSMMARQLAQMVRLVDDLLDLSRISRGRVELRVARLELASIIDQAVETSQPIAESFKHKLTVTLPPRPIYVNADQVRLAQVFSNLLHNAYKFTHDGGHIFLSADQQENQVVVSVKDTGIGIPPDKIESIFEMFSRIDESLRSQTGLGVGLTLVQHLVELHGGSIEARSDGPGKGSEFIVRLPVAIDGPTQQRSDDSAEEPVPAAKRRILVVDDNRDSAESLAMLLRLTGNDAHTAHDGQEAVEAAARLRPDVILLDIGLPGLSGYDACRRIREQSSGNNVVIIALTGWGQAEDRRKSSEAGFDGHLVKPVDYESLTKLLRMQQAATA